MLPILDLGFIQLPSFFLVLSLLMGLSFFLTTKRSIKLRLNVNESLDLVLALTIAAFVGARLGHVIFENSDYYLNDPLKVFYFWQGGFVFYTGFILSFFVGLLFLKFKQRLHNLGHSMQLFTPILSLSYALGRIGCFLEGCCYGRYCDLPWAVNDRHPTQIYSTLWELGVLILILQYESTNFQRLQKNPERLFFLWLFLHSLGRGLIEFLRDDYRGNSPIVSLSTWISLLFLGISMGYFLNGARKEKFR